MADKIYVSMLGGFSIRQGDICVDESSNRMRKVWLLLSYLIYSRCTHSSQESLFTVIQGADSSEIEDPAGRLKALLYRSRSILAKLYPNAGHELIVRKNGTYVWNTNFELELDVEEFDRLCKEAAAAEASAQKLELYHRALTLYRGDFLPKLSSEPWVMPINAYYHQQYLHIADEALELLTAAESWQQAAELCRSVLKIEPYSEPVYQQLMRCLIQLDDRAGALRIYEEMSELLFSTFGVMPSEESRQLYRSASQQTNDLSVPVGTVQEQLREQEIPGSAMYCEYDYFRFLYQVQARAIYRSGEVIHVALFSLDGQNDKPVSRRSMDLAMENFRVLLLKNLRRGDVVSKCSVSQFLVMLPQANYENSNMVCQRVIKSFQRQYPHSPITIRASVHPLEPQM